MTDVPTTTTALETEYLALVPNGWGTDGGSPQMALLHALEAMPYKEGVKPIQYVVFEATKDWEIDGFGSVTATKLRKSCKGEVPRAVAKRVWDALSDLEDSVTYVD